MLKNAHPFFSCLLLLLFLTGQSAAKEIFVINEDDSHFYGSRPAEQMNLEGLHAFIDQYANTKVTHLFLCPNSQNTGYASKVFDPIWTFLDRNPTTRWPANAKRLYDAGLDPYAIWIARCREKGISPWITARMNDIHNADDVEHWIHSSFWRKHPEYWRIPHGNAKPWMNRALNYVHREVYEYHFAFIRELLERYDMDGIELDWMRFGYHLTPGKEREEAHILTRFVAEVRQLADEIGKKRGRKILVSVRIPTHPDAAAGLGMDAVEWAKKGYVDWIVPAPFWTSSDFDIPVELWKERLAGTNVKVLPCSEHSFTPSPVIPRMANTLSSLYGWSDSARKRGADGLYLFNWMDCQTLPVKVNEYRILLEKGLTQDWIQTQKIRYPLSYRDTVPAGFPNGSQLPKRSRDGGEFIFQCGAAGAKIAAEGGTVRVILGLDKIQDSSVNVSLNGQKAVSVEVRETPEAGIGEKEQICCTFSSSAFLEGKNTVRVEPQEKSESWIRWVEIQVEPTK